jgi:hypothetical protein
MKPFFIEFQNLGRQILGHLGYFRPNYQHLFWYSESLVYDGDPATLTLNNWIKLVAYPMEASQCVVLNDGDAVIGQ